MIILVEEGMLYIWLVHSYSIPKVTTYNDLKVTYGTPSIGQLVKAALSVLIVYVSYVTKNWLH